MLGHRELKAALACFLLTVGSAAAWAGGKSSTHQVKVRYNAPADEGLKVYAEYLQSERLLEGIANSINGEIKLPRDLTLVATQCDTINAFYSPDDHTVSLCYELVAFFDILHTKDNTGENGEVDIEEVKTSVSGATQFVMYHEVGHALIDLLDLPITGKEEDAVDQLATVVLIGSDDDASTAAALNGAYTFLLQGQADDESAKEGEPRELAFWDEHSLDPQRFYNVTCWVYGSDPEQFADLVKDELIPQARAERCPAEWGQTAKAWVRLLTPYLKEPPAEQ